MPSPIPPPAVAGTPSAPAPRADVPAEAFVWLPGTAADEGGRGRPATDGAVDARLREVHHDLRQPLATVRALVFAAQTDETLSDLVRGCLARISDETERMIELCRHVLEGAGRRKVTDLAELAHEVASGCELATGCLVRFDADPVETLVDDVELRRALVNLLDNAARAAGHGGAVSLTVRQAHDGVRFTVEDSGPGFSRGSPGAASLGLAIVWGAAARLGGRVELEQSDLGGALVRLVVPFAAVDAG